MNNEYKKFETEDDIELLKKKDNYHVIKTIKWMTPVVVGLLLIGFFYEFFTNHLYKEAILGIIQSNISGIVFTSLYILGINYTRKKED